MSIVRFPPHRGGQAPRHAILEDRRVREIDGLALEAISFTGAVHALDHVKLLVPWQQHKPDCRCGTD